MPRDHRSEHHPKRRDDEAALVWREKELLDGELVDAGVIILRTSGCSHFHKGGCSMCGYNIESSGSVTPENIRKQFLRAVERLGDVRFLKIYTSGSFLDEREIPRDVAGEILRYAADHGTRLLFETRPEYVTYETLDRILKAHDRLEVALGLESANDRVLRYSINKGFTVKDYDDAARRLADRGIDVRTYILLKPPFLTEAEAIADARAAVAHASEVSKTVSLNPVNVQRGTLVERLWRNWAYRPPWLWSVLEVLRTSEKAGSRIVCDPTGGGKERGAHNCGRCDGVILDSIRAFSLSQDISKLGAPECECKDIWRRILDSEGFVVGGTCDLQRFFRKQRT